ncbi:MAG: RNA methyltransferase [Bacillota bacterium]|nr:RNA methyltransferase [Bacillota bacterium]
MKHITSKENPIYKRTRKLLKRKGRDGLGLYLLEGVKPVEDALRLKVEIEDIFLRYSNYEEGNISSDLLERGERMILLDDDLFDSISETESTQGVIAVIRKKAYKTEDIASLLGERIDYQRPRSMIILDRLQDPGNIGTIIRTAEAAGMAAVVVMPGTGDVFSPKTVRAAAGSIMRMPIIPMKDEEQVSTLLHEAGLKLVVTALEEASDYREVDLRPCGIVIGNEGQGVSLRFMELSDVKVKIPMEGEIESLNAAVAAGILMYAAERV